jgi:hypothetical protein
MANGQQLAEQNLLVFTTWLASKTDDDFRQLVSRGVLSRKEIAIECGFGKSALDQNPKIKKALTVAEDALRERGILPPTTREAPEQEGEPLIREVGKATRGVDVERLRRLEQDNASLRAENRELKQQLERYALIREALALTGRAPR